MDDSDWEYAEFIGGYKDEIYDNEDNDRCPRCSGSGEVPTESFESYLGDNYKTCPLCHGNG